MPAIAAAGQVFITNGSIGITTVGGQYLATAAPVELENIHLCLASINTTWVVAIPANARSYVINGSRGILNKTITVTGVQSGDVYYQGTVNGTTWHRIILPLGFDTSIQINVTDYSGLAENIIGYWGFNLDDFGAYTIPFGTNPKITLNNGKNTLITNARTPIRFGDDKQVLDYASGVVTGSSPVTVISSPGAGYSLVIWESAIINVSNLPANISIDDPVSGNIVNELVTSGYDSNKIIHGGLKLPTNTGLQLTTSINVVTASARIWYTVEPT